MGGLVQRIIDGHEYLFDELANPVTKTWFLVGSPLPLLLILSIYLLFVKRLGPWYMRNKKPYNLKKVIQFYNLFQVISSIYLFYEGMVYLLSNEYNCMCQGVDDLLLPRPYRGATAGYYYYILKIVDLLDTVFFVMRKSDRQITSLHLHHHMIMPFGVWLIFTYYPGGIFAITPTLNSLVHAVMYTYYYIAGLGEKYKKYLWWKRHVTELQLAQFVLLGTHTTNSLFYECGIPTWIKLAHIIYAGIFINMFGQFYYYNYIVNKKQNNEKKGAKNLPVDGNEDRKRKYADEKSKHPKNSKNSGTEHKKE